MSFQEATAVKRLTSHTYAVDLSDDWCIGSGKCIGHCIDMISGFQ